MLHWDGSSWSEVPSPGGGQSIVALGPDDVWSADTWTTGSAIAHFDGEQWSVVETVAGPNHSTLLDMAKAGECDLWAVGRQPGGGNFLPLIQRMTPSPLEGDLDGDGSVGFNDLLILLASWGACPSPPDPCVADINDDGSVGFGDLLVLLAAWSS